MTTACVRCGAPASGSMSFDYSLRAIWLEDLDGLQPPIGAYPMCGDHADSLTPPLRWTITDRRNIYRLFVPLEVA